MEAAARIKAVTKVPMALIASHDMLRPSSL
jgi:hypothetical protein